MTKVLNTQQKKSLSLYDGLILQMINNRALSSGIIDEKTKIKIDNMINIDMPIVAKRISN